MIKVSVIVPVYNTEKYLAKCLDSLVNQTLKDIEIIVVNDGTKDNSEKIINEYLKKYSKIRYYKKENGGLSSARNYGIELANGEYVGFVDSDDYVKDGMFSKMYECAIKNNSDIVVCDTIMKKETSEYVLKSNLKYSEDAVRNYIISYPMAPIRLVRKSLFKDYNFTEKILYEDLCLMPTLAIMTSKISFLNEGLYYYVQRDSSIMTSAFNEKQLDIFKVLNNVKDKFIENDLYKKYEKEIEYLYITHLLRSASYRFISVNNYKELLNRINLIFKKDYPNWHKNIYYKKSSFKLKLICNLSYYRLYTILKIIKKIKK